jgi:26S proteasome regulatory subunit N9
MYLSYTPVEELRVEDRYMLATDMSLAAITGDDVYNFGEVVRSCFCNNAVSYSVCQIATPILQYLDGTPNQWLREMIVAFNKGDIDQFNLLVDANRQAYYGQVALASRHEFVKQKMVMLTLMNMVFEKPAQERNIAFAESTLSCTL